MKTKLLLFILILSLAVNMAAIATVGYHYYRNVCLVPAIPCPLNQESRHLYQSLDLSDAQLAKMAPLAKSFHARLAALESQVAAKRYLLIKLMGQEEIDRGHIEEARKEIAAIQDKLQQEVLVHILQTRELLNPEQKKHFFEMLRVGMTGTRLNPAFPDTGGDK